MLKPRVYSSKDRQKIIKSEKFDQIDKYETAITEVDNSIMTTIVRDNLLIKDCDFFANSHSH